MMDATGLEITFPSDGSRSRRQGGRERPRRAPGLAILGLGCLLCLPATGCLFSTRTPEFPSVNNVPWLDPIEPAKVLTNVATTLSARSIGNYDRSLASDFTFVPAEADRAYLMGSGDPTFYDSPPWDKQRELDTLTSIFLESDGRVTFIFGPPIPLADAMLTDESDTGGGRFYKDLKYRMIFNRTTSDTTVSGLVNLYLRETTAGWSIYKWVDQQDGLGNPTLGLLRWRKRVWGTQSG